MLLKQELERRERLTEMESHEKQASGRQHNKMHSDMNRNARGVGEER